MTPPRSAGLDALLQRVSRDPAAFDFFHLLRQVDALSPGRPRLGTSAVPAEDALRIGQAPALTFAPAPLAALEPGDDGRPACLATHLFGLFGPNGPLPLHLTEHACHRAMHFGDHAFAAFVDVLHHRLATLFFRAWAAGEPTVSHDRPQEDVFAQQLAALSGHGMATLRDGDAMPDLAKLHFTGRLATLVRNPEGLVAILASFFRVRVALEEFAPGWVTLPADTLCRLGADPATGTLGDTATLGRRVRLCHHRFLLRLGPMRLAEYERLLPDGEGIGSLAAIVRNYVGDELGANVNLLLHHEDVPGIRLGRAGRLGWTSWIGARRTRSPADDLTFDPCSRPRRHEGSCA